MEQSFVCRRSYLLYTLPEVGLRRMARPTDCYFTKFRAPASEPRHLHRAF